MYARKIILLLLSISCLVLLYLSYQTYSIKKVLSAEGRLRDLGSLSDIRHRLGTDKWSTWSNRQPPDMHNKYSDDCEESNKVTHFVMTKAEKTGSSTLFAIFARFARVHHLNVLSQTSNWFINWDYKRGAVPGWDVGPSRVDQADVLINHCKYNKRMMDKYMVPDYKYIGIAREPVSWFISASKFFSNLTKVRNNHLELYKGSKTVNATVVLSNDEMLYTKRKDLSGLETWFHLVQLQWYGFDYRLRNNMAAITEHINWVAKQLDVVLLTDQFDASLVILRRRFCWRYTDIFYKKLVVGSSTSSPLSKEKIAKILSPKVNLGEKLLYDKLNETWWKQPELKEDKFWDEVRHFSELNLQVSTKWCKEVMKRGSSYIIAASEWHEALTITVELCDHMQKTNGEGLKSLVKYATGNIF